MVFDLGRDAQFRGRLVKYIVSHFKSVPVTAVTYRAVEATIGSDWKCQGSSVRRFVSPDAKLVQHDGNELEVASGASGASCRAEGRRSFTATWLKGA